MKRRTATSLPLGITALGFALIAGACSYASEPAGDVAEGRASGKATTIVVEGSAFKPAVLELEAGEEVTLEVANRDAMPHDFAVESLGLNTGVIDPGSVATATFTMPDRVLEFVCTYHDGMAGRIEPR
jgi:plastocyanin